MKSTPDPINHFCVPVDVAVSDPYARLQSPLHTGVEGYGVTQGTTRGVIAHGGISVNRSNSDVVRLEGESWLDS